MVFTAGYFISCCACEPVGALSFGGIFSFTQIAFTFYPERLKKCLNAKIICRSNKIRNKRNETSQFCGGILVVKTWWQANVVQVKYLLCLKHQDIGFVLFTLHTLHRWEILERNANVAICNCLVSFVPILCLTLTSLTNVLTDKAFTLSLILLCTHISWTLFHRWR